MTHTPGPWHTDGVVRADPNHEDKLFREVYIFDQINHEIGGYSVGCAHSAYAIATVLVDTDSLDGGIQQAKDDARLIAAAPDMLAACEAVDEQLRAWWHAWDSGQKLNEWAMRWQILDLHEQLRVAIAKARGE